MATSNQTKAQIKEFFRDNYLPFYEKYLSSVKKTNGNEYQARCPFPGHEDKNPSFSFNNANGMFFCHGCKAKGDLFNFYAELNGLNARGDFPKILKDIAMEFDIPVDGNRPQGQQEPAETYDYTDPEGNPVHQTVRFEPKRFSQRRWDGKGWVWGLNDTTLYLYRLPEVLKAEEVLIVEGEQDADTVASLGLTVAATCNAMGAGKWRSEYTDCLKGKDVVLIPDNDDPGRKHMIQVGAALQDVAKSIKWIDLPDLPDGGDLTNWVEKIGDKEEAAQALAEMIERAGEYESPKVRTIKDVILSEDNFMTVDLPVKDRVLSPWLSEQSITLISGWRGVGKTWFSMSLVDAITRGENFGPWPVEKPVTCLYLESEMPAIDVRKRFKALNPAGSEARKAPLFIYSDAYANHCGVVRANLLDEGWRQEMKRILTEREIKLFVLDNISSLCAGIEENSKQDWDPINSWLIELRFAGIATIMIHHMGKSGTPRGTSAREDNIDGSLELQRPHGYQAEEGARFVVHFSKSRVETASLSLIGDAEFHLKTDGDGKLAWHWENVKLLRKFEVLIMLDEGYDQIGICEALGIDKGYVSRVKKNAIQDGLLSNKNKLTPSGFMAVHKGEN